jgi:DNA-directed RNA polymerase specialized sigma24 family protein
MGPWTLTSPAFERLLAALDADRDRAALAYERLRERVIGLLRWWGAASPEELADETLDRVARKLEAGADIPDGSLGAYVRGVARMVFHEWTRRPRAAQGTVDVAAAPRDGSESAALDQLDACLDALDPAERGLLLKYYGEGRLADVRRHLAGELGLTQTALRIRAHRLRVRIETAMKRSLTYVHPLQGGTE